MASRLMKALEISLATIVVAIFFLVAEKYYGKDFFIDKYHDFSKDIQGFLSRDDEQSILCKVGEIRITLSDGILCREKSEDSKYIRMYDTYPKYADRGIIYSFFDEGDISIADQYLDGYLAVERYDPVKVDVITWEEDPYSEKYWRFLFYSLRETRHLLYAYRETGDERYQKKLVEIVESFLDNGMEKEHAWDDYHAVAFRSMVLSNVWWKLRQENSLPISLSNKILLALEKHVDFLGQDEHYEKEHNHGVNEAGALLLMSIAFPDFEESASYRDTAIQRFEDLLRTIVDVDGVLVENSPYYHLYVVEKFWEVNKYISKNQISKGLQEHLLSVLKKMISYATYTLQPDLNIPLSGASLERRVGMSGVFKEIAEKNPEFLYVITQGREGVSPKNISKYYENAGQVIMRSGWGRKTKFSNDFENQTQVVFDVGPYRTDHSDLDALSFSLFGNGKNIVVDTGLYSYEEGKLKDYFHGTRGHNTVIVDGMDQRVGSPVSGAFFEGKNFSVYSAQHDLYPKTYQQRSLALLGKDTVLVVDHMISNKDHVYDQVFHLFPGSKLEVRDNKVIVQDEDGKKVATIKQFSFAGGNISVEEGNEETGEGFCSLEYEKLIPCPMVKFQKSDRNTAFVTLISIGESESDVIDFYSGKDSYTVKTSKGVYDIHVQGNAGDYSDDLEAKTNLIGTKELTLSKNAEDWDISSDDEEGFVVANINGKIVLVSKEREAISWARPFYKVNIGGVGSYYSIDQDIVTDIPYDKVEGRGNYRVYEQEDFLPIFGYHNIISDRQDILSPTLEMHISDFEKQINFLTNTLGCRWFTIADIMENYVLKGIKTPKRACVLNFDDGRKNHYENAYKIFRNYGAIATFYIISERAEKWSSSYMDLADLNDLQRNGNEIGSHTVNASGLVGDGYGRGEVVYQLEESKKMLESDGYNIATFAYPRGEQNQEIVDIAKQFYIAGRDTNKDDHWRDMRTVTSSFDSDFMWHMHYHKPELNSLGDLEKIMGYNTWWQFEEGYYVDHDDDGDIRPLSSYDPTENSYAVMDVPDVGDKISNKFVVSEDNQYTIELFGTASSSQDQVFEHMINVFVDNKEVAVVDDKDDMCSIYKGQYYCLFAVNADLLKGEHILSVESFQKNVKLDKFRMYRTYPEKDSYELTVQEYQRTTPRRYPEDMVMSVRSIGIWDRVVMIFESFLKEIFV